MGPTIIFILSNVNNKDGVLGPTMFLEHNMTKTNTKKGILGYLFHLKVKKFPKTFGGKIRAKSR